MKVSEYMNKEQCIVSLSARTKEEAIVEIIGKLSASGKVIDRERFIADIMKRESLGSTGIGHHIAIPHAPTEGIESFLIGFGRSAEGIDFNSLDGEAVHLIFLMGTHPSELNMYLKLLAKLSKLLNEEAFRQSLMAAESVDEVMDIITRQES